MKRRSKNRTQSRSRVFPGFAVIAELVRDVILGLVAGLITTIAMVMSKTDDDSDIKLTRLKHWLAAKKLPKTFRLRAMQHFNNLWANQSSINFRLLAKECPPASELCQKTPRVFDVLPQC